MNGKWKKVMAGIMTPAMLLSAGFPVNVFASEETAASSFMEMLQRNYGEPAQQYKTEARWWLPEGSHTDETIIEEITAMHDQGFTGFELCMLDEAGSDDSIYAYGSESWSHDVKVAIETATSLGMSVGLTSGTHWQCANIPGLDPNSEAAGQEAGWSMTRVAAGESVSGALTKPKVREDREGEVDQTLIGVYAYKIDHDGSGAPDEGPSQQDPTILNQSSMVDLSDQVTVNDDNDWLLDWTAPDDGDYMLYVLCQQGTFETCDPAQTTAYAINYYNEAGVEALKDFIQNNILNDPELVEAVKNGNVQFFLDSLEIDNSDGTRSMYWTKDMKEEFLARKGYDISPYLPLFIGINVGSCFAGIIPGDTVDTEKTGPYVLGSGEEGNTELTWQILNDFYDVQTQLIQEKMITPLKEWAHENYNMTVRAQNPYGTYMEISEMAEAADYTETETLNMKDQPDLYRLWSGGAHIMNKLYSSETGAIGGMNYALSEEDYLRMSYDQYAVGVNRVIWHGHASSWGPEDTTAWPGYEGMYAGISTRLDSREPNSKDYVEMNNHLGRVQELLREGVSRTDIGILHLRYGENTAYPFSDMNAFREHKGLTWSDTSLQDNGYTYDYFSPDYLDNMTYDPENGLGENVGYQAIIVQQEVLPVEDAKTLLEFAKQGLKVVVLDGAGTKSPYNDDTAEELNSVMDELKALDNVKTAASEADAMTVLQEMDVRPRAELTGGNTQLMTQLRENEGDRYLYVYNYCDGSKCSIDHGLNATQEISLEGEYIPYYIDSWTGDVEEVANYRHEDGRTIITVDIDYCNVALYAFEPTEEEENHVTETDGKVLTKANGTTVMRVTESGSYKAVDNAGNETAVEAEVPEAQPLNNWKLTVESWEPGDKLTRSETRNTTVMEDGELVEKEVTTTEVKYDTKKTNIDVELSELKTWDEIEEVGQSVSGIGYYKTTFNWDSTKADGAYLDLGTIPQSVTVEVNGQKTAPVNVNDAVVDISEYLTDGENTLKVTVTSTLTNYLLSVGRMEEGPVGFTDYEVKYFKNGLSSVTLMPYVEKEIALNE